MLPESKSLVSIMDRKLAPGESTLKHLWDLANALEPTNHTNKLLRSYYLTICKKIGGREIVLPAVKFAPSVMCPRCSSIWSESEFSLRLIPQTIRSGKAQRLVDKLKSEPEKLTKKQRTRAKWLRKKITSHVETSCEFCKSKTLHPLIKPVTAPVVEEPKPVEVIEVPMKKKKKKKAKDKTAGLKLDKVTQPKPATKPNPWKQKPKVQQKKGKPPPPKVVSNTQKQNSLLQLANLLKNRTAATGAATSTNQLEKMLR